MILFDVSVFFGTWGLPRREGGAEESVSMWRMAFSCKVRNTKCSNHAPLDSSNFLELPSILPTLQHMRSVKFGESYVLATCQIC
jgi:hypothetical protein